MNELGLAQNPGNEVGLGGLVGRAVGCCIPVVCNQVPVSVGRQTQCESVMLDVGPCCFFRRIR